MVLKVVQKVELVSNEIKADDSLLELCLVIDSVSLVAAASDNRIEEEDWEPCGNEDSVLEQVDNEVRVEIARATVSRTSNPELVVPPIFLVLNEPNRIAEYSSFDGPFDKCWNSEALVTAWLEQDAVASSPVDAVKNAEAKSHAAHLCQETQVDQQVVVQKVEND